LAGCGGINANVIGAGPLPKLPEPAPLTFDEAEKADLERWNKENGKLFKKLQKQTHAYRETVRSYNEQARATNKKKLEMMGFNEQAIKDTLNDPASSGK
jgi:hypothetical protein